MFSLSQKWRTTKVFCSLFRWNFTPHPEQDGLYLIKIIVLIFFYYFFISFCFRLLISFTICFPSIFFISVYFVLFSLFSFRFVSFRFALYRLFSKQGKNRRIFTLRTTLQIEVWQW
jgi:hypothetical protein